MNPHSVVRIDWELGPPGVTTTHGHVEPRCQHEFRNGSRLVCRWYVDHLDDAIGGCKPCLGSGHRAGVSVDRGVAARAFDAQSAHLFCGETGLRESVRAFYRGWRMDSIANRTRLLV